MKHDTFSKSKKLLLATAAQSPPPPPFEQLHAVPKPAPSHSKHTNLQSCLKISSLMVGCRSYINTLPLSHFWSLTPSPERWDKYCYYSPERKREREGKAPGLWRSCVLGGGALLPSVAHLLGCCSDMLGSLWLHWAWLFGAHCFLCILPLVATLALAPRQLLQ